MLWARVHKIDRIRPLATGGATVFIEDERTPSQIQRHAPLSIVIAVARVLDAKQVLGSKYAGVGEVRYLGTAGMPSFLMDAIARAGAHVVERERDRVAMAAQPAAVDALVDVAFSDLAHHAKAHHDTTDLASTLKTLEAARKAKPYERDANPAEYWPAVFTIAALANELSRPRRAR
jgi:hypothetical protein